MVRVRVKVKVRKRVRVKGRVSVRIRVKGEVTCNGFDIFLCFILDEISTLLSIENYLHISIRVTS
jgi:hypothetical protein